MRNVLYSLLLGVSAVESSVLGGNVNVRYREVFTIKSPLRTGFVMGIWPLFIHS